MKSSHMKARLLGVWVGVLLGPLWMPVAAHAQDVVHVSDAKFRQLLERQEIVRERQAQSGSGDSQDEREPPVSPSPPPVSENEQSATKSTPAREGGNAPPVEEEKNSVAPPVQFSDWGLGLGIGVDLYSEEYVEHAKLNGDSRIVTVTDSYTSRPNIWAVGTWTPAYCGKFLSTLCEKVVKPGVFFGVNLDSNGKLVDAMSLGVQLTFMEEVIATNNGSDRGIRSYGPSWVVGVGWTNHSIRTLAGGIEKGSPLPSHFDDIEYRKGRENGIIVIFTKILRKK